MYVGFDPAKFDYSRVSTPGQTQLDYFNTSLITNPPPFTLGNSAPFISQLRGFASYNEDGGLQKNFGIHERFKVQFRAEAFNLFNHVNYGNYVTTIGAANFGAPVAQDNVAYKPRQLQLGFRATF